MGNKENTNIRPKLVKAPTKQAHFEVEVDLYEEFEKYAYSNGKTVSAMLRAYMKMCTGQS